MHRSRSFESHALASIVDASPKYFFALGMALALLLAGGCATMGADVERHETVVPHFDGKHVAGPNVWEWRNFCAREPAECTPVEGTRAIPFEVAVLVNANVNARVRYVEDRANFRLVDYWATAKDGVGDCEDFALTKRQELRRLGYSSDAMMLVALSSTGPGVADFHAVLLVRTDKGDVVLDNRHPYPILLRDTQMRVDAIEYRGQWYPLSHVAVAAHTARSGVAGPAL